MADFMSVKVSAKTLNLQFHECTIDFINNVCHGNCCKSSTNPNGTLITIHPSEVNKIQSLGATVLNNLLQPVNKHCPFQNECGTCALHNTSNKPFGCIASPFTLNKNNTLIIRNRYKMLSCYRQNQNGKPAYIIFGASLNLIFGEEETKEIINKINNGDDIVQANMPAVNYKMLIENDQIKKGTLGLKPNTWRMFK